jgi:tetratricopeptide (TPR) repeat protein
MAIPRAAAVARLGLTRWCGSGTRPDVRTRVILAVLGVLVIAALPVRAQSAAESNERGWTLLEQGDPARAAKAFAAGLAQRPDEPVLLLGAAVAAQQQGEPDQAKPRLQRALEIDPRFTPATLLLGEIFYRGGDLDRAIATYESALKHAAGNRDLSSRLATWRAEAEVQSTFIERRQDRFRVLFEGRTDAELAATATDVLSDAFWRIGQELGAYPPDPVHVILYTEQQFRDITRAPDWSGGLFDGKIRVPVAGASRAPQLFERVLSHELTHAMVTAIAPRGVPTWLHEGLAQYFDGTPVAAARRRLRAHRRRIPLEQLERGFGNLTAAGAAVAYDESLIAASAIVERRDITWTQLLYGLAGGANPRDTLASFGIEYGALQAAFEQ